MEIKAKCMNLFFLLIVVACFVAQIYGKKQGEAFHNPYKAKLLKNSIIDTSDFKPIQQIMDIEKGPSQYDLKERDEIFRLPSQPCVNFTQYGGYITVNETAERALYYYFVEAEHSKQYSPLILWLNGGPGCSSLIGAMTELGPFRVSYDTKHFTKINLLGIKTPAGVGFSYSNISSENESSGDTETAKYNYLFLLNWLKKFPEYKSRDFFITGESYAGHYIPQLAQTILYQNKIANRTIINLKGIIIGNAAIQDEIEYKGMYDFLATHAIISDETNDEIQTQCDFSPNATERSPRCKAALKKADDDTEDIDVYNIYAPICTDFELNKPKTNTSCVQNDPCNFIYVTNYLNQPEVQKAIHANDTKIKGKWGFCSGDTDAVVSVTTTKYSLKAMNLTKKHAWYPWYQHGEVGGYSEIYTNGMNFVTVRGSGHTVPQDQSERALAVITNFLRGTPLSNNSKYS